MVHATFFFTLLSLSSLHSMDLPMDFRPPAIPLVVHDPYTSIWSFSDKLTDEWTRHWTGKNRTMTGLIWVDGRTFRFLGPEELGGIILPQIRCMVYPTRTEYTFENEVVQLRLTFLTPMLTEQFKWLTCPVTFVQFELRAMDGNEHNARVYFDIGTDWCVNDEKQVVTWELKDTSAENIALLRAGTVEQPVLAKAGDNIRIDWGYVYLGCEKAEHIQWATMPRNEMIQHFISRGELLQGVDTSGPRAVNDNPVGLAVAIQFDKIGTQPRGKYVAIGYDDIYSIEFMFEKLRPWYWKEWGEDFALLMSKVYKEFPNLLEKCKLWDTEILQQATKLGGKEYSALVGLTYRHVLGSGKVVMGPDNTPWFFHKECFSNGCIATVDVSYPASPFFALFVPALLRGMLEPVFHYARSPEWIFDFAPHDVGTYPKANGQVYGKKDGVLVLESQMPVEECGNMILMMALYTEVTGKIDYAREHWDLLEKWANYLKVHGRDPENQLCTDDFAGHLAHNTNLSLKAIMALGAFAKVSNLRHLATAEEWRKTAEEMAQDWVQRAKDGDHFRLTFDRENTWSMKYNLVWDKILNLNLFPESVAELEMAHYKKVQNTYGLSLDCRNDYTKVDWLIWCATLTQKREDFNTLYLPFYLFMNETPDRVPLTDWYNTKTAKCVGFRARPVIGGVYLPFLYERALWKTFSNKAQKF